MEKQRIQGEKMRLIDDGDALVKPSTISHKIEKVLIQACRRITDIVRGMSNKLDWGQKDYQGRDSMFCRSSKGTKQINKNVGKF